MRGGGCGRSLRREGGSEMWITSVVLHMIASTLFDMSGSYRYQVMIV
jgi:hypothetical protein